MEYDFQKERYLLDIEGFKSERDLIEANIRNLHYQLAEIEFKIKAHEAQLDFYLSDKETEVEKEEVVVSEVLEQTKKERKLKKENG